MWLRYRLLQRKGFPAFYSYVIDSYAIASYM
jgi:hypothetical protein